MAKKSKTQRAKASAARKERKIEREQEEIAAAKMAEEAGSNIAAAKASEAAPAKAEPKKAEKAADSKDAKSSDKKTAAKPKKQRFQFFRDVRSELRRVTWPTRTDVLRWTGVVVVALLFFGVFVALLDNVVITPLLVFISGFGA